MYNFSYHLIHIKVPLLLPSQHLSLRRGAGVAGGRGRGGRGRSSGGVTGTGPVARPGEERRAFADWPGRRGPSSVATRRCVGRTDEGLSHLAAVGRFIRNIAVSGSLSTRRSAHGLPAPASSGARTDRMGGSLGTGHGLHPVSTALFLLMLMLLAREYLIVSSEAA